MKTKNFLKVLGVLIAVALLLAVLPQQAKADAPTPDTSWYKETDDSFTLADADDLAGLAQLVNAGNTFAGKTIQLGETIDLSTYTNWTPIGTAANPFKGTFDGAGKKITNLSFNGSTAVNVGLFGYVWPGTLKNVSIETVNITAKEAVGSLVGSMNGSIENVHVSGVTINSTHWAGGIVGYHYGDMSSCSAINATITLTFDTSISDNGDKAGGLIGYHGEGNYAINDCTAQNVSVTGVRDVGGLVGTAQAGNVFTNCHVIDSTVTASNATFVHSNPYAGGLIGRVANATVTLQYSSAVDVTVTSYVDGFAGNLVGGPAANWVNLPVMLVHDGTANFYSTIQAGINAASAGDTVNVAAGTYVENVVVNKAITLQGAGSDNTTIVATDGNATPLTFNTNGATVKGFHITHNYTQAELDAWNFNNNGVIFYQQKNGNTLSACKVTKNRNGIYINNAQNNIIQGNTIENNRTGINLTNYVDETQIKDNVIQNNWTLGLVYYQGSNNLPTHFDTVVVTGNHFIDNWYSEILIKNGPVTPQDSGTLDVTDNTFSDDPVTYTTSADAKWNEPGFADLKPVEFGGNATMPEKPLPTLRIYGVPGVTLRYDKKTLMVGADEPYTTIQSAINDASDGDTILVAAGTYNESLIVNKEINLIGEQNTRTFDSVAIGQRAPGVWYVDRYAPAFFESTSFEGKTVLRHGVLGSQKQDSSFSNYQGRKLDVNLSGPTITVSIDLFVGSDWSSKQRNAGFWATGLNSTNGISAYPMIAWRSGGTDPAGFYAFDYFYGGWHLLHPATGGDYGKWHNLAFTYNVGEGVSYFVDGEFKWSFADSYTTQIANIILNVYNFGEDYDVYWDNLTDYTNEAKVTGRINITASGVVVDGLTLENPGQPIAVDIKSTVSNLSLKHNVIQNVGGSSVGQMQAVYLEHGPDNILIEGNTFKDISSGTSSAKAILSGDSNTTNQVENLVIRANTFTNISASRGAYGVLLNNGAGNPGVIIEANAFNGLSGTWTHAIGLEGPTPDAQVKNNTFTGLTATSADNSAIFFEDNSAGGTVAVQFNKFFHTGFGVGIHPDDQSGGTNDFDYTVKASPNWWGSISGPVISSQIFGPVSYDPWCGDAECSFLNPNYLPSGVSAADIQAAIDAAPVGAIIVIPEGTHNKSGGFTISKPGITIRLANGAIIQNNSPCFIVNADNVTITAETIGGAKCVPTSGSDGIVVNDGVQGLRIYGLEIDGNDSTGSHDGIHFNGTINEFQILDNYIHNMGGHAINFVGTPSGTTMDIQGNLFKGNAGSAIAVPDSFVGPLNAKYNSWGSYAAPSINKVDTSNNTYVKVYLTSSDTPWANQVVAGSTIKYTVMADLSNITGAEITLIYPPDLQIVSDSLIGGETFDAEILDNETNGKITYYGYQYPDEQSGKPSPISGEAKPLFEVTFTVLTAGSYPLSFDTATDNFAMAPELGASNFVYADSLTGATIKGITLPTITSSGLEGYYLTGEFHEFTVTTANPADGGDYLHVIFPIEITAQSIDGVVLQVKTGDTTWDDVELTCDDVNNKCTGSFGPEGGFPMTAPYNVITTFRATATVAKNYPIKVQLIDLETEEDYELAKLEKTAVVYLKPTITSPDLEGNHQGLTQTFTVNVNNMSTMVDPLTSNPITFLLHFGGLPTDATVTIANQSDMCDANGCDVSVTLNAGTNALSVQVVFPANFTGDVTISLFDSLAEPDRLLQSAAFEGVKVYANIPSVTGVVSMQGRMYRGGIVVKLTGPDGFAFGPYTVQSLDQLGDNVVFSNLASSDYTITITQPRYLEITADLGAHIDLSLKVAIDALVLRGGDVIEDDVVNILDAGLIGGNFRQTGSNIADANFDGVVNIQDLAMVGSNFGLTSRSAYVDWMGIVNP